MPWVHDDAPNSSHTQSRQRQKISNGSKPDLGTQKNVIENTPSKTYPSRTPLNIFHLAFDRGGVVTRGGGNPHGGRLSRVAVHIFHVGMAPGRSCSPRVCRGGAIHRRDPCCPSLAASGAASVTLLGCGIGVFHGQLTGAVRVSRRRDGW